MFTLVLRNFTLIGLATVAPYLLMPNLKGILVGIALGVILVITEFAFKKFNIISILSVASGSLAGFALFRLGVYAVERAQNAELTSFWNENTFAITAVFILLGLGLGIKKAADFEYLNAELITQGKKRHKNFKVLDISAIIDGRVIDLFETNFLTGTFIVPRFVLSYIQDTAHSKDPLERARGRRGLDIIAKLRESKDITFKIVDKKIPEEKNHCTKIVKFAKNIGADIITTDFNINKTASLNNVTVLNIDDLTTALKPVVLPGEAMSIFVMKDGKEKEQGVGYLDDGTMVVVEEGRKWVGKKIDVFVYSILQTSAGRMIFVKAKSDSKQYNPHHHKVRS